MSDDVLKAMALAFQAETIGEGYSPAVEAARAALVAAEVAGYALVPIEPTQAMLDEGDTQFANHQSYDNRPELRAAWKSMIAVHQSGPSNVRSEEGKDG